MEHPILFSGNMVRAILDNRKTQTRRIIKPQPKNVNNWFYHSDYYDNSNGAFYPDTDNAKPKILKSPYGLKGDLLWVRESLRRYKNLEFLGEEKYTAQYMATNTAVPYAPGAKEGWCGVALWQWKNTACPSIHMPRWACRLTLKITNVRIEKLQHISIDDIGKEGYYKFSGNPSDEGLYIHQFVKSWDFLNAKRGYSWDNNPWVWVIEFKVL